MSPAKTPKTIRPSVSEILVADVAVKFEPILRLKLRSPGPKAIQLKVRRKNSNVTADFAE